MCVCVCVCFYIYIDGVREILGKYSIPSSSGESQTNTC